MLGGETRKVIVKSNHHHDKMGCDSNSREGVNKVCVCAARYGVMGS